MSTINNNFVNFAFMIFIRLPHKIPELSPISSCIYAGRISIVPYNSWMKICGTEIFHSENRDFSGTTSAYVKLRETSEQISLLQFEWENTFPKVKDDVLDC